MSSIETTVTIKHMYDSDYEPEKWLFQDEDYRAEDEARLAAWRRDDWHAIGIRVEVRIHNWTTGNTREYSSAGLWGIESDSGEDYLLEVAQEQLEQLQAEFDELRAVTLEGAKVQYE